MRISQLESRPVALWGWGREGRATYRVLRTRLPAQPLTLFCSEHERADALSLHDTHLSIETDASGERLGTFDVVIKSPGISPYSPAAIAAAALGTRFVGGTTLWFSEYAHAHPNAQTICVTGTKGKSTTTALLAHLLRAGGQRTALCGNIGLPLLELLQPPSQPDVWAIELSSYQTRDVAASGVRPQIAICTNLFPEHLDWHGNEAQYVEDKLALLRDAKPRIAVLNRRDAVLSGLVLPDSEVRWYGDADTWHLRGDTICRGEHVVLDVRDLPLPGDHNRGNLCAVLTAIEALGLDAVALAPYAATFQPLPHRLQTLGVRDDVTYVNDSISTTPHATLAALTCFQNRRVALLVGGHDRGIDWHDFAEAMHAQAPYAIIAMGANGAKIHALLAPVASATGFHLRHVDDLESAVAMARELLSESGDDKRARTLLLSPGAPSFDAYRDYTERGRHFASLAGFDPQTITAIPGLGVA